MFHISVAITKIVYLYFDTLRNDLTYCNEKIKEHIIIKIMRIRKLRNVQKSVSIPFITVSCPKHWFKILLMDYTAVIIHTTSFAWGILQDLFVINYYFTLSLTSHWQPNPKKQPILYSRYINISSLHIQIFHSRRQLGNC